MRSCGKTSVWWVIRGLKHDDVIKWKLFPHYWPFVLGIHRSPVNSRHKGQWRGALMFSLICVWINGWLNNGEAGDLRCYRAHYDVTVMISWFAALFGFHPISGQLFHVYGRTDCSVTTGCSEGCQSDSFTSTEGSKECKSDILIVTWGTVKPLI